ncbi:hypothetical protein H6G97_20875 [Nostoc flagelliforme FACHB-838]|uniref:Uncharacterized protein n=1 Tax=Nostoc flagelliforme FACHB-838 TaxID=2692904 RepID=A0ABR8DRS5_9NOSO|nr:hypothetical protein [Nostoc flagelliforme FACHB-838]
MSQFSAYELEQLAKLPSEIAALANKYRVDIVNAGEFWDQPPFPDNYIPELVEIYYGYTDSPDVFIRNGVLEDYRVRNLDDNTPSVAVQIDDQWAYIQIEGREILNRLGGVVLPDVIVKPSLLLNSVFKGQNHA